MLLSAAKKPAAKPVQVRNTNTAMGKALAAAMGGVTFEAADNKKSFTVTFEFVCNILPKCAEFVEHCRFF